MRYQVNVSGGAGSAIAAIRAVERFGKEACRLVFADTRQEDPTLYQGLDWLEAFLGMPIKRLSDGRDIWDVFFEQKGMRFNGGCKASIELKHIPLNRHLIEMGTPDEVTVVMGLDWQEPERIYGTESRRGWIERLQPYTLYCPLLEEPRMGQCEMIRWLEARGYPPQTLYHDHFPHNNCGGGCILAGLGQWERLLKYYPERFAHHEAKEAEFNRVVRAGKEPFSVLRDRRGGAVTTMLLSDFRRRVENGETFEDARTGCGCLLSAPNLFEMLL